MHSSPAGAGAQTWDLPHARQKLPAARHGRCLDSVSLSVATDAQKPHAARFEDSLCKIL